MYRRALKLVRREASPQDDSVATLYHNLGGLEHARDRRAKGLRYAIRGIELRKKVRPRDRLALIGDEVALAALLSDLGRNTEAERIYSRALRVFRHSYGPNHHEVAAVLANLGALYAKTARPVAAERALRRALRILEKCLGRNHPRIASALNNLAVVCARRGKFIEAVALYRRVLRLLARHPRNAYPQPALVRQNLKKLPLMQRSIS